MSWLTVVAGELDLDAPVVRYWPEFGQNGKSGTLVRHLPAHRAGLPALREAVPEGALFDRALITCAWSEVSPLWTPRTGRPATAGRRAASGSADRGGRRYGETP